ncbi:AAA family ATPase [Furfurilactobacillus siliginis]|uniref:Superfamily I DNA and RNA helicase-like protein n=1 Tax=Furfurilactobacillus siliginis TaxID=348151 RepID=A0A0R2L6V8_9LACO|nr:AAA family ATPase [Furfurilactobacillus siliginis]KRN97185.1 Superfamily I DNA and RNA helicase-like protein [Furfurilactobacillus siliginis]GEK28646.1 hypothetical protein LSI01_09570 [Furfurilactobacillus siliginis]
METEAQHLHTIFNTLTTDVHKLTKRLAALTTEGRSVKQQLGQDGHLDLGSITETLDTFANIEANNRQIDALNVRYDATSIRLAHAKLLIPQAYFAKLTLDYGDDDPEAVYLGKVGYADDDAHDLIYDWRAPVAEAYYANRTGATSYQANNRTIEVTVLGRRQFVIDHDRLVSVVNTTAALTDELLLAVLAENRRDGLQEITATIQAEQNAIIRETQHPVVLVDGVAGSGKTSVLLQRVAFQLYQHRGDWSPDAVLLITPNKAFRQYIQGVLPALGEQEPLSVTYPTLIHQLGTQFGFADVTQANNHIVQLAKRIQQPVDLTPLQLPENALHQTSATMPFVARMRGVWRWLAAVHQLPDDPASWLNWHTVAHMLGVSSLTTYDQLYLLFALTDYHQTSTKAVFIDEAQDYDDDTWALLTTIFGTAEFTIVGDHRQRLFGTAPSITTWFTNRSVQPLNLTTSYRATGAITAFFAQYATEWSPLIQAVQAPGLMPTQRKLTTWSELLATNKLADDQSLGIITPTPAAAKRLADEIPDTTRLTRQGQTKISAGINILDLVTAKGLEFDHVIIVDWDSDYYTDPQNGANRRYVAASRGTKTLTLLT